MNEGKQKFIGGVDFDELRAQRVQVYNAITVDLATARINEEMVFTGNYIYALEATDVDANLDIRFNELFRAAINVKKGRGVRIPFYRFYITNTAQAGKTLTLAIGIEAADFEIFDVGKALGITGTVDVDVVADSAQYNYTELGTRFGGGHYHTISGGYFSGVLLKNIGSSGEIILIERIYLYSAGAGERSLVGLWATDGSEELKGTNMKLGEADSLIGSVQSFDVVTLTGVTPIFEFMGVGIMDTPMILSNGERLIVINGLVDQTVCASFIWREI